MQLEPGLHVEGPPMPYKCSRAHPHFTVVLFKHTPIMTTLHSDPRRHFHGRCWHFVAAVAGSRRIAGALQHDSAKAGVVANPEAAWSYRRNADEPNASPSILSGKPNRLPVLTNSCSSEAATGESARRNATESLWRPATATPKAAAAARPGGCPHGSRKPR